MFKEEVKKKLDIKNAILPFVLTLFGKNKAVVSGVKNIIFADSNKLKLRISDGLLRIEGSDIEIVEMGGGDLYVKGDITGVGFE